MDCTNCELKNNFCKPNYTSLAQETNIFHYAYAENFIDKEHLIRVLDSFNIDDFCYLNCALKLTECLDNTDYIFKYFKNSKKKKVKSLIEVLYFLFKNPADGELQKLLTEYRVNNTYINKTFSSKYMKDLEKTSILTNLEKEVLTKARIGQSKFKEQLVYIDCSCKLCGLSDKNFLDASHIKPWSKSSNEEKINPYNGFLLCPNHDRLFDRGYMTFSDDGNIIISSKINTKDYTYLSINDKMKIHLHEKNKKFIRWHRENIFVDNRK